MDCSGHIQCNTCSKHFPRSEFISNRKTPLPTKTCRICRDRASKANRKYMAKKKLKNPKKVIPSKPTSKSPKTTKRSNNNFHDPALAKMKHFESSLPEVPEDQPKLSEILGTRDNQCIYCGGPAPPINPQKRVEGDEIYPCTLPEGYDSTINGRYNSLNKYACCKSCNSSKNQKINDDFIKWIETGGIDNTIPLHHRPLIVLWYKCNKCWITTSDKIVLDEMKSLKKIKSEEKKMFI